MLTLTCNTNTTLCAECPENVVITMPDGPSYTAGDALTCSSDGYPAPTYSWTVDGVDGSITSMQTLQQGGHVYVCSATVTYGGGTTCSDTATRTVMAYSKYWNQYNTIITINNYVSGTWLYLQSASAQFIFRLWCFDHITDALISFHWLHVQWCITFKIVITTYQAVNSSAPAYLSSYFTRVTDVPSRQKLRSTSTKQLAVLLFNFSTVGKLAFLVSCASSETVFYHTWHLHHHSRYSESVSRHFSFTCHIRP